MLSAKRILIVYIAAGPITSDAKSDLITCGGVRTSTLNILSSLKESGHHVSVLALEGSDPSIVNYQVSGDCFSLNYNTNHHHISSEPMVAQLWQKTLELQSQFDIILNMGNDWLPIYLMPFFTTPVLTRLNFASNNIEIQNIVKQRSREYPMRLCALSKAHADHYQSLEHLFIVNNGICVDDYRFYEKAHEPTLVCLSRISPEKDIIESARIAQASGFSLVLYGAICDKAYFEELMKSYSHVIDYRGCLEPHEVKELLGKHLALLLTPQWTEAFGIVAIEALACGLPIVVPQHGGPNEVVEAADTNIGFTYPKGDISTAVSMIKKLHMINRQDCRNHAYSYNLDMLAHRLNHWFDAALAG